MSGTSATWQRYTTANSGLSHDYVADVAEDTSGALWFATYGGGLCRFDPEAQTWRTYRSAEGGLIDDTVGLVAADGEGRIWTVCDPQGERRYEFTGDGVVVYPPVQPGGLCALSPDGTWQTYPEAVPGRGVLALEADRDGGLWLAIGSPPEGMRGGTDRFQAYRWRRFDGTTWTDYANRQEAVTAWYPHRLSHTRLGWAVRGESVWLLEVISQEPPAMSSSSLLPLGLPSLSMIPGMGSFLNEYVLSSYEGGAGWKRRATAPSGHRFESLVMDRDGHAWISLVQLGDIVLGSGVARLDSEEGEGVWTIFDATSGLANNNVQAMTVDSRGHLWLSCFISDLCRWDGKQWTTFPGGEEGRGTETLGQGFEDRHGRLWFPSKAGALCYTPE